MSPKKTTNNRKRDKPLDAVGLRRRAEARLRKRKRGEAARPGTKEETQRLIHELQVHQIELQMQNEELQQARHEVEAGLKQYTDLYDFAPVGYFTLTRDGTIRRVNLTGARVLGGERSRLVNRRFGLFVSNESRPAFNALLEGVFENRGSETCEVMLCTEGEEPLWAHIEATCSEDGRECRVAVVDVTAPKQRESELVAIAALSAALRTAQTRAEMLPVILDQLLVLLRAEGAGLAMRDPASGDTVVELARGEFAKGPRLRTTPGQGVSGAVIAGGKPYVTADIRKETGIAQPEMFGTVRAVACVPLTVQDQIIGALRVGRQSEISANEVRLLTSIADIAANAIHRETMHEQTVEQMLRLAALQAIDRAITGSSDLLVTLNVILEQADAQLKADAAAVLLLNPHAHTLGYAAGRGFRDRAIEHVRVRLGEGQAGRAALERRTLSLPDLAAADSDLSRAPLIQREGFVSHHVTPLVAKGQVKGVLEVFQRAPFNPDPDWLNFFETLAGQVAIAIDNTQLFEGLQRSNVELSLAYDATIEGWSKALDLRDKETEGHTRRVTEMTLHLAQAMGIGESDLVHLRRGALLHDISKLGIPDSILFKPGELSEEEWELMRQHPQSAYDMLLPIAYLRPALDIPYCHHEKWDGTGYPRGLKGEEIPLGARLFAVVDVWDALRSDRPYRAAWPQEKALEHIRSQAGRHFDPEAVELFFQVVSEKAKEQKQGAAG